MLLLKCVCFRLYRFLAFVYRDRDFLQLNPNQGLCVVSDLSCAEAFGLVRSKVCSADSSNKLHNLFVSSFMSVWVVIESVESRYLIMFSILARSKLSLNCVNFC